VIEADHESAYQIFRQACEYISRAGLHAEVTRQREVSFDDFTESELLCEAAWVIMCSGFREATVRRIFGSLSLCFCDWESAALISADRKACKSSALRIFRHEKKLDGIVAVAGRIVDAGFDNVRRAVIANPIVELQKFPYIGPITALHLAKNLGFNVAKPDRHLARVSSRLGFDSALALCASVAQRFGEEIKVVDLVIWRFLADNPVHRKAVA
jgi:hypothetical protein